MSGIPLIWIQLFLILTKFGVIKPKFRFFNNSGPTFANQLNLAQNFSWTQKERNLAN